MILRHTVSQRKPLKQCRLCFGPIIVEFPSIRRQIEPVITLQISENFLTKLTQSRRCWGVANAKSWGKPNTRSRKVGPSLTFVGRPFVWPLGQPSVIVLRLVICSVCFLGRIVPPLPQGQGQVRRVLWSWSICILLFWVKKPCEHVL